MRTIPTRAAGALFLALAAGHLATQLAGADTAAQATQFLLMPALAAVVLTVPPGPLTRPLLVALGFSWLGDSVPALFTGDTAFLTMVGLFLCAQITYAVAFWPLRGESVLGRPAVAVYVAAFGGLLVACVPGAGGLLVPVVVYGLCLTLVAVLSTGVHRLAGIGGALFFVSDGLIALRAFADWYTPPVPGFWVMLTYVAGQALITAGVLARQRVPVAAGTPA
ncbi:lysoplasmalogenase [Actinophytocola xinjiangensis]|uniref:Lysoplasmalogenase n=1 Tax=Actinophytocola xinjiangensis TaxID=485602 RepID=A0A7Z0WHV4_9PSEU|nr:lysoplasmalogenase [Actinophytocola xinjiangensis]OLF05713.1 lysoplasmalogenase [Actinophytocola xinjiangensis]